MKLKRLFTAILSAALTLSLCAMPAMAADGSTAATTLKTSTSTIDTTKKGSITIYKRAESGTPSTTAGTGEKVESPNGEPLPNAGFSIYTVLGTDELVAYYNGLSTGAATEVTVDSCFNNATSRTEGNLKSNISAAKFGEEKFTDAGEGKVVFDELPVGLYLVIETTSPAAVTKKVDPFLISIPMTRIGADAAETVNKNQESWLYDVTVYPKNSIAKGNVTLEKKGVTGANVVSLNGVTFELFKKNDLNDNYTSQGSQPTGTDGRITFENLTKGSYYLKETGYTDGNDKGYILNTDGKFAFDVDADGKVIASTDNQLSGKVEDGSFVISTDSQSQVQLTVNNYRPDIDKTVTKRDGTANTHEADYGVGDAVPYTLTIKVPENITSLKTFTVTDTTVKTQLVQNKDSVKISGKNNAGGDVTLAESAYTITVAPDANNSVMTVAFTPSALTDVAGGEITIAYTATVQDTAVVAGNGNVNTAKIVYSRKTNLTEETGGNKPYEITDKGVVYTFGLNIHKTAKGGTKDGAGLKDVAFDLYKKVADYEIDTDGKVATTIRGKTYSDSDLCADAVKLGLTTDSTEKWIKIETLTTGENGNVSAKGLPSGIYKLVETKTVDGYNLLSKPVDAKLNLTYAAAWSTTTTYDANGNQTKSTITTPTYKRDGADVTDPSAEIEIVNRAGFTLPVTGGFGTLLFSGIGVLLVLAGVGVLFSLKKKSNRA